MMLKEELLVSIYGTANGRQAACILDRFDIAHVFCICPLTQDRTFQPQSTSTSCNQCHSSRSSRVFGHNARHWLRKTGSCKRALRQRTKSLRGLSRRRRRDNVSAIKRWKSWVKGLSHSKPDMSTSLVARTSWSQI